VSPVSSVILSYIISVDQLLIPRAIILSVVTKDDAGGRRGGERCDERSRSTRLGRSGGARLGWEGAALGRRSPCVGFDGASPSCGPLWASMMGSHFVAVAIASRTLAMVPPELEDNEDQSSTEASTMFNGTMLSILMG
jgi:hypothetical protein